jgi:M6 family metalloprotease-like protein
MHARKTFAFRSLLFLLMLILVPIMALAASQAINPTPSVVSGLQPTRAIVNSIDGEFYTFPGELPDTMRVLAIRVHFQPDTISTTFGDGDFMYDFPDTVNPEGWILDAPPHDKQFFLDQLLAARNYFEKYSYGKLVLAGLDDSSEGGDVYPAGDEESYLLDYPIWSINYGNDDHERLNERLVDLFVDAWTLADNDLDVNVADYDMFIVFHAGAGNEFDTGYDMTPFDIPSVFISENDLAEFGGITDGIQMSDGVIRNGIILPETQRQPGVDVGMHGTVVAQIGFAIGLPHLYNTENGDSGIGMFGLMDRGFGAYFGTIPIPPSAWARAFMRWDEPVTISGFSEMDTVRVGGLHLPDSVFSDNLDDPGNVARLLRIPLNDSEYYLIESRLRDPDEDSLSFATDRSGKRITFHDDYSWEADEGFRVAVTYSDNDFDLPASGVLIWHVDDQRIKKRYRRDDLQNSFDYRAIRLMEADGTWDIGNEYPFLTAGDGTEYGYFADAFYRDNEFWREANRPLFNPEFATNTNPSTITNDGGFTHMTLSRFSDIDDTMSFRLSNNWVEEGFPVQLDWERVYDITAGDFNGDGIDEVVTQGRIDGQTPEGGTKFAILDSAGVQPYDLSAINALSQFGLGVAIDDLDMDGDDELIIAGYTGIIVAQKAEGSNEFVSRHYEIESMGSSGTVAVARSNDDTPFVIARYVNREGETYVMALQYSDPLDQPTIFTKLEHGSDHYDWGTILVSGDPQQGPDAIIWMPDFSFYQFEFSAGELHYSAAENLPPALGDPSLIEAADTGVHRKIAADFSQDGRTEYIGQYVSPDDQKYLIHMELQEAVDEPWLQPVYRAIQLDELPYEFRVLDLDQDGFLEPAYLRFNSNEIVAIELNGIQSENSPLILSRQAGRAFDYLPLILDSDGDNTLEWITSGSWQNKSWSPAVITAYDLIDGRVMPGFPLFVPMELEASRVTLSAANLDSDANLELIAILQVLEQPIVIVYNLPGFSGDKELVWSEPGGNPANTRYTSIESSQTATRAAFTMDDAYCWPNPVLNEDVAHFRYPANDGDAELVIYDLAGRQHMSRSVSAQSGGLDVEQAEIEVDVSTLPSGVYVARLEVGGEVKLIRFAVVN